MNKPKLGSIIEPTLQSLLASPMKRIGAICASFKAALIGRELVKEHGPNL